MNNYINNSAFTLLVLFLASPAGAAVFNNNWQSSLGGTTFSDATTNGNRHSCSGDSCWTITPGADNYYQESYERPTSDMDESYGGAPAAKKYYQYLDIKTGQVAFDNVNKHAYFSIDLVGQYEVDQSGSLSHKGFGEFYRIRVADNTDFANGYMFGVKDPYGNGVGSTFNGSNNSKTTQSWIDKGTPVTGTGLTTTNEGTSGYTQHTSEGDTSAIQSRIVGNSVQIAIAFGDLGIDKDFFYNIIFEANKGLTDPSNSFWNDEYSLDEAGSPYDLSNPVENIYELDTMISAIPIPATVWLFGSGILGLIGFSRRRKPASL
ncbi:MAG: PEP-CTERM sorting domain-containing protein [Gammaproteobacteria bacterium]|nr:PEP-CTERM sorting domain-containing protein [Gammaproteobacteria bacterium]